MDESDAELHDITKDYGGVFDPSALPQSLKEPFLDLPRSATAIVDGLRKHMKPAWANRNFRMAFVDDTKTINAFARKGDYADYVIVTVPLVEKIFGTMYGMMCVPTFLPKIGLSVQEELPVEDLSSGFPIMPLAADQSARPLTRFYSPADHDRRVLAHMLASAALDFLLAHEIGHIVGGHLDMLEQRSLAPAINEFGHVENAERIPKRYVLECDADTFAAHMESFIDLRPESDHYWAEAFGWNDIPGHKAGFIFHASAIGILFRLFDALRGDEPPPLDHGSSTHPHPAVRSSMAISRSLTLALIAKRFTMDDLSDLIKTSLWPIESIWQELRLPGQRLGIKTEWASQIAKLSSQVATDYEQSQQLLEEFSRVPPRWHIAWPDVE